MSNNVKIYECNLDNTHGNFYFHLAHYHIREYFGVLRNTRNHYWHNCTGTLVSYTIDGSLQFSKTCTGILRFRRVSQMAMNMWQNLLSTFYAVKKKNSIRLLWKAGNHQQNYLEQLRKGHNLNYNDCEILKSRLVLLCQQLLQYRATRWTSHASVVVIWGYTTVLLTMVCLLQQIRLSTLKFTVSTCLLKYYRHRRRHYHHHHHHHHHHHYHTTTTTITTTTTTTTTTTNTTIIFMIRLSSWTVKITGIKIFPSTCLLDIVGIL